MSYADAAASALADITDAGAAVTFTKVTPGTYDKTTSTWTDAADLTVSGFAIQTGPNLVLYQALGLVLADTETLIFAPSTFGAEPALGASVTWNGIGYVVRDVATVSPDGNAILARVTVSR